MNGYWVTYKIEARYVTVVEAENIEEALAKAEDEYIDADFGAAGDIEGFPVTVEDDFGDIVWEK